VRIGGLSLGGIGLPDYAPLASGRRINRLGDDAGGLAVSLELRSRSTRNEVASRNISDGALGCFLQARANVHSHVALRLL
jgi:hypothetical protein